MYAKSHEKRFERSTKWIRRRADARQRRVSLGILRRQLGASPLFQRLGFSIIELIVVLAVLAVLTALLIPAVQQSREAARNVQCLNSLRQIGIAFHNYHDKFQTLPPAVIWAGPPGEPLGKGARPVGVLDRVFLGEPGSDRVCANWLILLLPTLDQGPLANNFDPKLPIADVKNAAVRLTWLPVLTCPTDAQNGKHNPYIRDLVAGTQNNQYARGNYAMNLGPDRGCIIEVQGGCTDGFHVDDKDLEKKNTQLWGSGVGGVNKAFSFKDFKDGISTMVAVDEVRSGVHPADPRGTWALGFIGASITARHGLHDGREDDAGPNNLSIGADDIVGCGYMEREQGQQWLRDQHMPCHAEMQDGPEINTQATARSMHPGGVHVLMLDGSAHFVGDAVTLDIWYSMHSRDHKTNLALPF